jgi:hypothetical protein
MADARIRVAADSERFIKSPSPMGRAPRFRDINTADSPVGPPHPDTFDREEQASLGNGCAIAFARRDEDPLAGPGGERSPVQL